MRVYMSVCDFACVCVYVCSEWFMYMIGSVCWCVSVGVCFYVYLASVYIWICMSVHVCVCECVCECVGRRVYESVCVFVCLCERIEVGVVCERVYTCVFVIMCVIV